MLEIQQKARGCRLPRPGLADDAQRFTRVQLQGNAIDGGQNSMPGKTECLHEALRLEHDLGADGNSWLYDPGALPR